MLISTTGKSSDPLRPSGSRGAADLGGDAGESGFTLLELIIVSALAAIFLTLSIPALRNTLVGGELQSAGRKVIGTVQELRNLAVRQHKDYLLHFDLNGGQLWYEEDTPEKDLEGEEKVTLQLPDAVRLEEVRFGAGEPASQREATLWISRKGYMDRTAVYLSDDESRELTIVFSPFSGAAEVYDEHVEVQ